MTSAQHRWNDRALLHKKGSPLTAKMATRFEDLLQDCITMLAKIESNLRIKGDIWRAEQVKQFRIEYFGKTKEELSQEYRRAPC